MAGALAAFRLEFGAGLIKLRGDSCWRDLTCLYYHHETQPMPGPLSWFFHHLPKPLHRAEVAGNHFAQLVVPFGLFAPQPVASVAGAIIVITQLWLVASGNFAWLNWLTILLGFSAIDASSAAALLPIAKQPALAEAPQWFGDLVIVFTVLPAVLSYWPVRNMLSRRQPMNMSFDPFHLINSYGAFGTIGRTRREVVIEGTANRSSPSRRCGRNTSSKASPEQCADGRRNGRPYHLRLDWLMWFAAITPHYARPVVSTIPVAAVRERSADAPPAARQPFPGVPAPLRARPALPIPLHHRGRTAARSDMVASDAGGQLCAAHCVGETCGAAYVRRQSAMTSATDRTDRPFRLNEVRTRREDQPHMPSAPRRATASRPAGRAGRSGGDSPSSRPDRRSARRRGLFVPGQHKADAGCGQRLHKADVLLARQPEDHIHTLVFQALDHQLSGCTHPVPPCGHDSGRLDTGRFTKQSKRRMSACPSPRSTRPPGRRSRLSPRLPPTKSTPRSCARKTGSPITATYQLRAASQVGECHSRPARGRS